MATLEEFRQVRSTLSADKQSDLASEVFSNPDKALAEIISICTNAGLPISEDEVRSFMGQMDDSDEFDDVELDVMALAAISGGFGSSSDRRRSAGSCC